MPFELTILFSQLYSTILEDFISCLYILSFVLLTTKFKVPCWK